MIIHLQRFTVKQMAKTEKIKLIEVPVTLYVTENYMAQLVKREGKFIGITHLGLCFDEDEVEIIPHKKNKELDA